MGILLPFLYLALSLGLTATCLLDMAHFPTVVTLGCLEFAVFGQVTGAITAITGRRCPFVNNQDAGTCKFGALLLSCLQLLDISVGNLGGLAQVESLVE